MMMNLDRDALLSFCLLCPLCCGAGCASTPAPQPESTTTSPGDEADASDSIATSKDQMSDALRRVVQENIEDLRQCYQDELRVTPDFDGRMKLGLTIGDQGTIIEVSVEYSESVSPRDQFTSCLYNEVLMWTFPIPPSPPMKVVYPLKFTS